MTLKKGIELYKVKNISTLSKIFIILYLNHTCVYIADQMKFFAEALAKQQVILNRLSTKQNDIESMTNKFPIENEEQLLKLNENILPENRNDYVSCILHFFITCTFYIVYHL